MHAHAHAYTENYVKAARSLILYNKTGMTYHSIRHTSQAKNIMRVEHTNPQREISYINSSHSWPNVMEHACNLTTSEVEAKGSEFEASITQ